MIYPVKMVMFHSYVAVYQRFSEGKVTRISPKNPGLSRFCFALWKISCGFGQAGQKGGVAMPSRVKHGIFKGVYIVMGVPLVIIHFERWHFP